VQVINKVCYVWNHISKLREIHSCYVLTYKSGFWGGLPFWLHREMLTFKGPATWQATAVYRIGVNRISPNFDTLFTTSL